MRLRRDQAKMKLRPSWELLSLSCWELLSLSCWELRPCWDQAETKLRAAETWDYADTVLRPCWDHAETMLRPCWDHAETKLPPNWKQTNMKVRQSRHWAETERKPSWVSIQILSLESSWHNWDVCIRTNFMGCCSLAVTTHFCLTRGRVPKNCWMGLLRGPSDGDQNPICTLYQWDCTYLGRSLFSCTTT